jgi:hypothetical protein
MPQRQVQDRRVAEAHERLRISRGRIEIDPIRDAVCALPPARRKDRAHAGIAKRVVQVGEAILVSPREIVTVSIERVRSDLRDQTPMGKKLGPAHHAVTIRRARGRDDADAIAGTKAREGVHHGR